MSEKNCVYPAEPYRENALGSYGNARSMLINQENFPDTFLDNDIILKGWSDRFDWNHWLHCLSKYPEISAIQDHALVSWLQESDPGIIKQFLIELLDADESIAWVGFRITATEDNGHTRWFFELFFKHPRSDISLYSGFNAPNILPGRRQ